MVTMTARQRVLEYLRKQRVASAGQIGHGLNMSAAAVRHHLTVMLADGRIILIGGKRQGNRGRPVKLYGLSEKSIGDNFPLLADAVLTELLKVRSAAEGADAIDAIAQELALRVGREVDLNIPMVKRLAIVVEKLNEMHYQARWEAGAQGPRILFAHCPYSAIITKHPELCQMDTTMVGVAMKNPVRQISKQEFGVTQFCIFMLDPTS